MTPHRPFPDLSFNYVAPVTCSDGSAAVLKVGIPWPQKADEIAWLHHYQSVANGAAVVRLLRVDLSASGELLGRALPGQPLSSIDDDEATIALAAAMRRLRLPPPSGVKLPHVRQWFANGLTDYVARFGRAGPIPATLVDRARDVSNALLGSAAPDALLHGDLHHDNVLRDDDYWVVIDPKGVLGEPDYEVAAMLRNGVVEHLSGQPLSSALQRRLALLSEHLDADRQRLAGWGFAQTVLSCCWAATADSTRGLEHGIEIAMQLSAQT